MRAYSFVTANQKWESLHTLIEAAKGTGVKASGSVELTGGASGSVDGITVNSIEIMSGAESFDTDLATTAQAVVDNINANTSSPNYTATRDGDTIDIIADEAGTSFNSLTVTASTTTITTTDTNTSGGTNGSNIEPEGYQWSEMEIKNTHASANLIVTESTGRQSTHRPLDIGGYEVDAGETVRLSAKRNEIINGENIWVRSNAAGSFCIMFQNKM